MSFRTSLVVVAASSLLLFSRSASAADDAAPAPAAPAAPAAAPAAGAPAPAGEAAAEAEPGSRFRWGISALGGPVIYGGGGGTHGGGGVDLRFGAQINNMFAVYGQPVFLVSGGQTVSAGAGGASVSQSAFIFGGVGVLGDVTLADLVYLAAGPELMAIGGGGVSATSGAGGSSSSVSAGTGTFFSVAARAGLALGSVKPTRRKAFTIGLDFRAIFTSNVTVAPLVALGYESF